MVDCETDGEFQAPLESLNDVWNEREKAHLPARKQPSFYQYISEKVTALILKVTRSIINFRVP